jgi:hydroxymethylpyrimidine pyrophosphatase-like HAD family hydrolase
VRRAADHLARLAASTRPRAVYTDLDGTLLGPGGSLFASPHGGVTSRAAEAVAALHRRGIALVPTSGRAETTVREAARVLGADGYVAELGGITVRGDEVVRARGAHRGTDTPYEAMVRSGAAGLLLDAFPGRLELHAPWTLHRECSMLFRGHVERAAAVEALREAGYDWLTLEDNGIVRRRFPGLDVDQVHVYHLVPVGVSKAAAIAADLAARDLEGPEAVAVGDAPTDVEAAPYVAAVFIVANGEDAVGPGLPENVYLTGAPYGDGFAEAILGLLGSS